MAAHVDKLPDFSLGVSYWANTEASVNGVLGGFGPSTPVPRLDATSTRLLLLSLLPGLSTITPPHHTSKSTKPRSSYRALDCGAGIGRVTSTVLLPLFDRVDLVEPVRKFVDQAKRNAGKGKEGWKGLKSGRGCRMWLAGLQYFDPLAPAVPVDGGEVEHITTLGSESLVWPDPEQVVDIKEDGYDTILIQWCIGHLSDPQLVEFLKRSRKALKEGENGCEGYIVLKENTCKDTDGEGAGLLFDDEDSSITRSDKVFRKVFADAGLKIIKREVQQGFPAELFPVVSYALR